MTYNWPGFLRMMAGKGDTDAKVLLNIGGSAPHDTRNRIQAAFDKGHTDFDSLNIRMAALMVMRDRYEDGSPLKEHDRGDWFVLGNGAYQRREHHDPEMQVLG